MVSRIRDHAAYKRARRARLAGTLAPNDYRHGTTCGYIEYSCRCNRCRAAMADYNRARNERIRAAKAEEAGGWG